MSSPTAPRASDRGLRVDAERNRQRIVAAAREAFAESGLDVPMEDIARRAGVGVGTLYRRYPTRADLVAAAFEVKMRAYADAARQALADPDPWHGFCAYVEKICSMQAGDRGFTTVLTMTFPTAKQFEASRDRAFGDFTTLIERAKAAGRLRADFATEDMPMFLMANAGVLTSIGDAAPEAWRRFVGYLLQACAAQSAQPLPDPPAPRQMYRAMLRATGHQRGARRTGATAVTGPGEDQPRPADTGEQAPQTFLAG
jgi:AcrR family transcriptional regulator